MGIGNFIRGLWPPRNYYLKPPTIGMFFNRVVFDFALENPELLSLARILERFGIYRHNSRLTDVSGRFRQTQNHRFRVDLKILRSYDFERLTPQEQISYRVLEWYLENEARRQPFLYHDYPVNQLSGVHKELPTFMITIHQLETGRDARHYIQRLKGFKRKLRQVTRRMQKAAKQGIYPPRFVVEKVIQELDEFVKPKAKSHSLFTTFQSKVRNLNRVSPRQARKYCQAVEEALQEHVYPAYQELRQYFNSILEQVSDDDGVWKLPDGERYYAYVLRSHLTTDLSPREVHDLGWREMERIEGELRLALEKLGYDTAQPLAATLQSLNVDERFTYPDDYEGRLACLDAYEQMVREAEQKLPELVADVPQKEVIIERLPRFKESTSPEAYYEPPSYGGDRSGIFYVNLGDMRKVVKWAMPTLAYHETVPGHHLQVALQMELEEVPFFRKIIPFTAFVEGWALYAERLAYEEGWLKDEYANIGRLQSELLRAVRLIVDTGIHWKRWTRQEAIAFMRQHAGMPEPAIVAEVERYIVNPGQACAYKIGELKLLALRDKVKQTLGDRYDAKAFHSLLLNNGSIPLDVLELIVDEYLAQHADS